MIQNPNFLGASTSIVTERLFGSQPTNDDFKNFRTIDSNLNVQRTLFGKTYTPDESRRRLEKFMKHWADHRFGEWMFRLADGTFVGTGGLFYDVIDDEEVVALGYVIDEPYWGQGFATEIARASMRVAFDELQVAVAYGVIEPDNIPSRRVLEKSGFSYVKDFLYHGEWPSALLRATSPSN